MATDPGSPIKARGSDTGRGIEEARVLGFVMPAGLEEAFEDPDRFDEVLR